MFEEMLAMARNAELQREVDSIQRRIETLERAKKASSLEGNGSRHNTLTRVWRTAFGLR